jgi:hypothetical protein
MHLVLFTVHRSGTRAVHQSGTRADVTSEANADVTSDLLYRFCICLSINPNKPYCISVQAVLKL